MAFRGLGFRVWGLWAFVRPSLWKFLCFHCTNPARLSALYTSSGGLCLLQNTEKSPTSDDNQENTDRIPIPTGLV